MKQLQELVADAGRRQGVVRDCVALVESEVRSKGGLSGMAIKTVFNVVKALNLRGESNVLVVDDLTDGLSAFLDDKGMTSVSELVGRAVPSVTDWQYLNLNHIEKAVIDQELCIKCGRCHIVCEDTSHQAITHTVNGERRFEVIDEECVGCNLCVSVCPIDGCITMRQLTDGFDPRTGQPVSNEKANWTTHPNNPMRKTS